MFRAAIVLTFIIPDSAACKQKTTISSEAIVHLLLYEKTKQKTTHTNPREVIQI